MRKLYDFELIGAMARCIENNGAADEFDELAKVFYSEGYDKYELSILFEHADLSDAGRCIAINFISVYAGRFPDSFRKQAENGCSTLKSFAFMAMLRDIIACRSSAETLADVVLGADESENETYFGDALQTAALCGNDSFFDYILSRTKKPINYFCGELYRYLSDSGRYDMIEKIIKGASGQEIMDSYKTNACSSYFFVESRKNEIEYIYELAGYIYGHGSGDEYARNVSDMIEKMEIPISGNEDLIFRIDPSDDRISAPMPEAPCDLVRKACPQLVSAWEFMSEHGLRFRSLDYIFGDDGYRKLSDEQKPIFLSMLKSFVVPILDERVRISEELTAGLDISQQEMILSLIELIGADRVILDCTNDDAHKDYSEKLCRASLSLIKSGAEIVLDEDLQNSRFIGKLLNSSGAFEYMLKNGRFSDGQTDVLIELCVARKLYTPLNIIRKYRKQ
ncbi:MAG: hypothetical protein ACI4XF_05065 [Oscillospiraceae bacterium]